MNPILSSVVGLCKRGWCASTPPSCWSKEDGPWRAISRLSFSTCALRSSSYCRAHKERREREREESRVSRTRARVHTKRIQKHSKQRERRHHHHHHHQKEGERAKHDARTNEPSSRATKKFFFFFFLIFFFLIFNPYLLLSVFRCHLNARRTSIEHRMEAKKWATQL